MIIVMKKTILISLAFILISCGPSPEERQDIAQLTCNIMGESRNMDGALRIKEINAAREKLGEAIFLGSDVEIKESFEYGLCSNLVLNENYDQLLKDEIEARRAEELRLFEKARLAEEARLAALAEEERLAEEARLAALAEEARLAQCVTFQSELSALTKEKQAAEKNLILLEWELDIIEPLVNQGVESTMELIRLSQGISAAEASILQWESVAKNIRLAGCF